MNTENYEKAIRIIMGASKAAQFKFWLCFGNLLHLVRDGSIEDDHDIDIGILYEEMDEFKLCRAMEKHEYKVAKIIRNDLDGKPFYINFDYCGQRSLPPIDVFAWFGNGKYRYHTYDVRHEGKEIPKMYTFKGVPDKYLPIIGLVPRFDPRLVHMFFGKWNKPLFSMEIPVPFYMGTLLDLWYPNWLKPRKMQSVSPYVVEMKSCKQWSDASYINEQLETSQNKYRIEKLQYK